MVSNTGNRTGDAVVLGFINSTDSQFPRQKLFDLERVKLDPGQNTTVLLTVTSEDFSVVDEAGSRWLKPSIFTVSVGDILTPARHRFVVGGEDTLLEPYWYA